MKNKVGIKRLAAMCMALMMLLWLVPGATLAAEEGEAPIPEISSGVETDEGPEDIGDTASDGSSFAPENGTSESEPAADEAGGQNAEASSSETQSEPASRPEPPMAPTNGAVPTNDGPEGEEGGGEGSGEGGGEGGNEGGGEGGSEGETELPADLDQVFSFLFASGTPLESGGFKVDQGANVSFEVVIEPRYVDLLQSDYNISYEWYKEGVSEPVGSGTGMPIFWSFDARVDERGRYRGEVKVTARDSDDPYEENYSIPSFTLLVLEPIDLSVEFTNVPLRFGSNSAVAITLKKADGSALDRHAVNYLLERTNTSVEPNLTEPVAQSDTETKTNEHGIYDFSFDIVYPYDTYDLNVTIPEDLDNQYQGAQRSYTKEATKQDQPDVTLASEKIEANYGDVSVSVADIIAAQVLNSGDLQGDLVVGVYPDSEEIVELNADGDELLIRKAGTASLYIQAQGNDNFNPSDQADFVLEVQPAVVSVNADALTATRKYDPENTEIRVQTAEGSNVVPGGLSGLRDGDALDLVFVFGQLAEGELIEEEGILVAAPGAYTAVLTFSIDSTQGNYVFDSESKYTLTASFERLAQITPKVVTVGATVKDKAFNGSDTAIVESSWVNGLFGHDDGYVGFAEIGEARFDSAGIGPHDILWDTAFVLGAGEAGDRSGRYMLAEPSMPAGVTGEIYESYEPTGDEYVISDPNPIGTGWYGPFDTFSITAVEGYELNMGDPLNEHDWVTELVGANAEPGEEITFRVRDLTNDNVISTETTVSYDKDITDPVLAVSYTDTWTTQFTESLLGRDDINWLYYGRLAEGESMIIVQAADESPVGAPSGLYSIKYWLLNEVGEALEGSERTLALEDMDGTGTLYFSLSTEYKGFLRVEATDKAGNVTTFNSFTDDEYGVVVDTTAPTASVDFSGLVRATNGVLQDVEFPDPANPAQRFYFDAATTATITITEANFFPGDVEVYHDDGTGEVRVDPDTLAWTDLPDDAHTTTYELAAEGTHTLRVEYTDKSGNVMAEYQSPQLIVDEHRPEITLEYDNNAPANDTFFDAARTATLTIEEENFRPADVAVTVKVNGVADEAYARTTAADWTSDGSTHTTQLVFANEGTYELEISYTDLAGWENDGIHVPDGNLAPFEFMVDATPPTGTITYKLWNSVEDGTTWDRFLNAISFGLYYKEAVQVDLTAADGGSGVHSAEYLRTRAELDEDAIREERDGWVTLSNPEAHTFLVDDDEQFLVYLHIVDRAGNEAYLHSDGAIVDMTAPAEITITPEPANGNDFYNGDVDVLIEVVDPETNGTYSGLKSVVYEVKADGHTTQTETLFEETEANRQQQSFEDTVTVRAALNNSNNVELIVTVEDNAGNTASESVDLMIDTDAPTVQVAYANIIRATTQALRDTAPDAHNPEQNLYFNATATATIQIAERNFAGEEVEVYHNGTRVPASALTWVADDSGRVHTATFDLAAEGVHDLRVEYTDLAGNDMDSHQSPQLIVDKTNPAISLDYNRDTATNDKYFARQRTATVTIVEDNFRAADVVLTVKVNGQVDASYSLASDARWSHNGNRHTATLVFNREADYELSLRYTDLADRANDPIGLAAGTVAPYQFTIDWTAPTGSVAFTAWNSTDGGTLWDRFLNAITFGLYYREAVQVSVASADNLSGVHTLRYLRTSEVLNTEQLRTRTSGWVSTVLNGNAFRVERDEAVIVYLEITDKSGNKTYISSNGAIVDFTDPSVEQLAPYISISPEQPLNGIYNADVPVAISVTDPAANGVFSGLKRVDFEVQNQGVTTRQETLFQTDGSHRQSWSGGVTVSAGENNSNDVKLIVTVEDNAGNIATREETIQIDVTPPSIRVTFDNNSPDPTFDTYFNQSRTATIVVTERNFDPSLVDVTITNEHGSIPSLSGWGTNEGGGNGDGTTHTATVTFSDDGDYTFEVTVRDLAGNAGTAADYSGSATPNRFTIDQTLPVITVSFDNNTPFRDNYYGEARLATVQIEEHNFEDTRVNITVTATDNGSPATVPAPSGFSTSGDIHTATVSFAEDALYTIEVEYTDMAGNEAIPFAQETFYVDVTDPELSITNVADRSANNGEVRPVITYSDSNLDVSGIEITLEGYNNGKISPTGTYTTVPGGREFTFDDFEHEPELDDVYTLTAQVTDLAGHTSEETILFSVNRYGSTYVADETTAQLNGSFVSAEQDIVITEINVDLLERKTLTLFKDGDTRTLEEGGDFGVQEEGGEDTWKQYTYHVYKENFGEDGIYSLSLYSQDRAGNESESSMENKELEIRFGVDKTPPGVYVVDLENNATYPEDTKQVDVNVSDNLLLAGVSITLDGKQVGSWEGEDLDAMVAANSPFSFTVGGDTSAHSVEVLAVDAAGNETVQRVENFYVTTNLWVRFITNRGLLLGLGIGAGALLLGSLLLVSYRGRKKGAAKSDK